MKKRKKKKVTLEDLIKYLKKHNVSADDAIILLKANEIKERLWVINMNKQIKRLTKASSGKH